MFGLADDQAAQAWLQQLESKIPEEKDFAVYPENLLSVQVFCALQNSWRLLIGMTTSVYQGLDYTALRSVLELMNIPRKQWAALFNDIRTMENAALPELNRKR